MSRVQAANVTVEFNQSGEIPFDPVSFNLEKGELLIITGPNGAGKSTLLKKICGFESRGTGTIHLDCPVDRISYLPQLGNLHFLLPIQLDEVRDLGHVRCATKNKNQKRSWNQASGGERQRTLLDLIFHLDSDLIILDEPFNHLDDQAIEHVIEHIKAKMKAGVSFIMATHRLSSLDALGPKYLTLNPKEKS